MRQVYFFIVIASLQLGKAQIQIPLPDLTDQSDKNWVINDLLDSLLNKSDIRNGIICVNERAIMIDTVVTGKVKRYDADSITVGKFLKKNQKKISSKEFWGIVTADGDCRRFYKNEAYLIWETPSPYIYKQQRGLETRLYFSESLVSTIYPLDKQTITISSLNYDSKTELYKALEDFQRSEEFRVRENREMIASISLDVLNIILQIMVSNTAHQNHHTIEPRSKQQTGPRSNRGRK